MRARYPLVRIGRGKRPFPPFSTKSAENLLPFFLLQRIRRGGKRRGAASPRAGKERGEESARKGPRRSRQAFLAQFLASLQTPPGRREVRGSRRIHNPLKRLHSPVGSSPPPSVPSPAFLQSFPRSNTGPSSTERQPHFSLASSPSKSAGRLSPRNRSRRERSVHLPSHLQKQHPRGVMDQASVMIIFPYRSSRRKRTLLHL